VRDTADGNRVWKRSSLNPFDVLAIDRLVFIGQWRELADPGIAYLNLGTRGSGNLMVAAFMENMARYELGDGSRWPGLPVDGAAVSEVFGPLTRDLRVARVDADPGLSDYGYTGMVLLTARRR